MNIVESRANNGLQYDLQFPRQSEIYRSLTQACSSSSKVDEDGYEYIHDIVSKIR